MLHFVTDMNVCKKQKNCSKNPRQRRIYRSSEVRMRHLGSFNAVAPTPRLLRAEQEKQCRRLGWMLQLLSSLHRITDRGEFALNG